MWLNFKQEGVTNDGKRKNGDVEDKHSHSQRRTWNFPQWLQGYFEQDLYNKCRQFIYHI